MEDIKTIMESLQHWKQKRPWTVGSYTYATDGAIIIRVPKFGGYGSSGPKMPKDDFPFAETGVTQYELIEPKVFVYEDCDEGCFGDCENGDYRCKDGRLFLSSIGVKQRNGQILNQQIIYIFKKLKTVTVYFPDKYDLAGYFRFDEGDGHFMCMRPTVKTMPEVRQCNTQ